MKKMPLITCATALCCSWTTHNLFADTLGRKDFTLSTVDVISSDTNGDLSDAAFATPGAVVYRDLSNNTANLDSVVRSLPGVYTQIDPLQGALSVNIRGFSGFGRVNTLVDGIPQTYDGFSMQPSGFHNFEGAGTSGSAYGATIDPNFITSVDVSKGTTTGAGGINALIGSANFRTINVEDVVKPGQPIGVLIRGGFGDGNIGNNIMTAAGLKKEFNNSSSFGIIYGFAARKLKSQYDDFASDRDLWLESDDDFYANNKKQFKQKPKSHLVKAEYQIDENNKLEGSFRSYKNRIGYREIDSKDWYIKYFLNPKSNPWINLTTTYSKSYNTQEGENDSSVIGGTFSDATRKNNSSTFDINNTTEINNNAGDFKLNYGIYLLKNKYDRNFVNVTSYKESAISWVMPKGSQENRSLYFTADYKLDKFSTTAGFNYTKYKIRSPDTGYCEIWGECYVVSSRHLNSSKFSPSILISYDFLDEFQPFVSVSKSYRLPNIREVFGGDYGDASINDNLKGESSWNYELGFNSMFSGIITNGDFLGLKLTGFYSKVSDFIYSAMLEPRPEAFTQMYINSEKKVTSKGIELESRYDAGIFFSRLSISIERSNEPLNYSAFKFATRPQMDQYTKLPKSYATIEIGTRLLEKKLKLSIIANYVGKTEIQNPITSEDPDYNFDTAARGKSFKAPSIPITLDFEGNYDISNDIQLNFAVRNFADRKYVEANNAFNTGGLNDTSPQLYQRLKSAQGINFFAGIRARF